MPTYAGTIATRAGISVFTWLLRMTLAWYFVQYVYCWVRDTIIAKKSRWKIGFSFDQIVYRFNPLQRPDDANVHRWICHNLLLDMLPISRPMLTLQIFLFEHMGIHVNTHFSEIWININLKKMSLNHTKNNWIFRHVHAIIRIPSFGHFYFGDWITTQVCVRC